MINWNIHAYFWFVWEMILDLDNILEILTKRLKSLYRLIYISLGNISFFPSEYMFQIYDLISDFKIAK